jgi:Protein of unknown function (DUF3433)
MGRKKERHYRPVATSPWTLIGVLCVIAGYITLLEILLSRQHEVASSQASYRFDRERRQVGLGPTDMPLGGAGRSGPTGLGAPESDHQLSLTSPTRIPLPLTGPISTFTTSDGAQLSLTSPYVSRTLSAASQCQPTLTYTFGDPYPTGCYQTTETWMPSIPESSQMTITQGISTTTSVTQGVSTTTSVTQGISATISGIPTFPTSDPMPSSQLAMTTSGTIGFTLSELHVEISGTFTKLDYFLSLYLPTLLAVLLQTVWAVVFAATKMMEPFYQLASPDGALAKDSILVEYLSSAMSISTLRTMLSGHWVMLLASVIYFSAGLLAPLASESMGVQPTATCHTAIAVDQPCAPAWIVFLPATRALEALLAFLLITVFLLLIISSRRMSGVYENPTSIRSMVNLLGEPAVQRDFQDIEPNATKSDVKKALSGNRYRLGYFEASPGFHRFGLTKVTQTEPWQGSSSQYGYTAVDNPSQPCENKSRPPIWSRFLRDGLFLLLLLTLFGLILGYYLDNRQTDSLNKFFNSNTFGPRFLLSSLAVLISVGWKQAERETRIMEPYRKLASGLRPGKGTIDVAMTGTPYSTVFIALGRGDLFVSWTALMAILSDILIIAVTGVPFSPAQIHEAGLASFYISFGILSLMILSLLAVVIRRRSNPRMPRDPDTLAHVWLYVCASSMTQKKGEMYQSDVSQYWFGLSTGSDGKQRWMIDKDQHGVAQALNSY